MKTIFNRSTISFAVNETLGVLIVLHEMVLTDGERLYFLVLAGALMGLPFVLAADQRIGSSREPNPEPEEDRWSHLP